MATAKQSDTDFEALLEFLKRSRAFDFTGYKRSSLQRRVDKRMLVLGLTDYARYTDLLQVQPEEFSALFDTILINVTGFFRDAAAWETLRTELLPALVEARAKTVPIRVWSAGCASGEEAYTAAMLLAELIGPEMFRRRVKIYGTDVDEHALTQGRSALYTPDAIKDVPDELRQRYFEPHNGRFAFRADLRRCVVFGRHDLVNDAPISRLDLLICRNTLMYFNTEIQRRILARFHFALSEGGALFMGKAEMVVARGELFEPVDLRARIFRKVAVPDARERLSVLQLANGTDIGMEPSTTGEIALEHVPLAVMVVDQTGRLVTANQQARELFRISERDRGRVFSDLDVSYQPIEVRSRMAEAAATQQPVRMENVAARLGDHDYRFDVTVVPFRRGSRSGVAICFEDVSHFHVLEQELQRSTSELETAYEELQSANEELETTNEELQSTIEELETTNEELQATNEELETMNAELQSTNDELEAINIELSRRTSQLNHASREIGAILSSVRAGLVVLDETLRVQVWNRGAENLWGLREEEVKGEPFLNLDIGLPVQELDQAIHTCADGNAEQIVHLVRATNRRGKAVAARVVVSPYLVEDSVPRGVVLLMHEDGQEQ